MKEVGNYILTFLVFGAFMYLVLPIFRKGMTNHQRMIKAAWGSLIFTLVKAILNFLPR